MRSARSRISRRHAWRQAGPIWRTAARSNFRRRSTNSNGESSRTRRRSARSGRKLARLHGSSSSGSGGFPISRCRFRRLRRTGSAHSTTTFGRRLYEFFADVRPLEDFRGAICGGTYDRDMLKEAGMISAMYAVNIGLLAEKRHAYEDAVAEAQVEAGRLPDLEGQRFEGGANERRELVPQAQSGPGRPSFLRGAVPAGPAQPDQHRPKVGRTEGGSRAGLADGIVGHRLQEPPLGPARESPFEYGEHCFLCVPAIARRS